MKIVNRTIYFLWSASMWTGQLNANIAIESDRIQQVSIYSAVSKFSTNKVGECCSVHSGKSTGKVLEGRGWGLGIRIQL